MPPRGIDPRAPGDPTALTARALRERATELGACAPSSGGVLRVHLEITVAPAGAVTDVRITNLEGVPTSVADCLVSKARTFTPPGFDATEPQAFVLTVVL